MNKALDEFMNRSSSQSMTERVLAEKIQENDTQEESDYRAFGINRNRRQVLMLDVRVLSGERLALGYPYLNSIFFDASGVIVLSFGSHNIRIEGRNLAPVYEGLLNHAVRYVQEENPDLERDISETETFISSIEIGEAQ